MPATLRRLFLALSLAGLSLPALAQDQQAPNYDAWNKMADQAEQILETGQANEARLQAIRAEVDDVIINYSTGAIGIPIDKRISSGRTPALICSSGDS